jgi:hypothetical protein
MASRKIPFHFSFRNVTSRLFGLLGNIVGINLTKPLPSALDGVLDVFVDPGEIH